MLTSSIEKLVAASLDRQSRIPVYLQIASGLKHLVRKGVLAPGTPLPPERVLCAEFGVSRMTLRQAYDVLEREQIIERHRGRGPFVSPQRVQKYQQEMRSFTEEMRARGLVPHSRLLGFRVAHPSAGARDFFGLPQHESVYRIERLRYAGNTPLAVEAVEMPCYLCPNLVRFNLATHSLYNVLEGEYGLRLARCLETISARPASRQERKLLELPRGVAVLLIERRSYTSNDTPVEMGVSRYRADLYRAVVHSRRTAL